MAMFTVGLPFMFSALSEYQSGLESQPLTRDRKDPLKETVQLADNQYRSEWFRPDGIDRPGRFP